MRNGNFRLRAAEALYQRAQTLMSINVCTREEKDEIARIWMLLKVLADMKFIEAMETFLDRIKKTKSNAEFLMSLGRADWS